MTGSDRGDGRGHRGEGLLRRLGAASASCRAARGQAIQQPAWGSHSAGMRKPSAAGVDVRVRAIAVGPYAPDRTTGAPPRVEMA